jgi:hypothetical protein
MSSRKLTCRKNLESLADLTELEISSSFGLCVLSWVVSQCKSAVGGGDLLEGGFSGDAED